MSGGAVQAVILAEDVQLQCFVRRFLIHRGWDKRHILGKTAPSGAGSGEQWVREKFVEELRAYRERAQRAQTCLFVCTDADVSTVNQRITTLQRHCEEAPEPWLEAGEKVVLVVPKRNIETWLAYLRDGKADENREDPYPKYEHESDCAPQVVRLAEMCQSGKLEGYPPPSLSRACAEYSKLGR